MILPINDIESNRYMSWPFMTLAIITTNVLVMCYQTVLEFNDLPAYVEFIHVYGATPSLIMSRQGGGGLTAITHQFVHGGLFHLVGNMVGLWVYGRRVEDACGPWRFLVFYLLCGLCAHTLFTVTDIDSIRPGIGASGSLYGVMGAYLILYPTGRIRVWFGLTWWLGRSVPVRAYWIILFYLLGELAIGFYTLFSQIDVRIAHWAHLGGFFGSVLVFLFLRPEVFHRYRNDLPL